MRKKIHLLALSFFLLVLNSPTPARAQSTAFTYQGSLSADGGAANGTYDVAFSLYGSGAGGAPLAGPVTNQTVTVSNGLFTTTIDFGNPFTGASLWLELAVRTNGASAFSTLAPRQPLTPVPYAITAANVTGPVPASQLTGLLPISQLSGALTPAQLPGNVLTNGAAGAYLTGTFQGDGSELTHLSSAALAFTNSSTLSWGWNGFGQATIPPGLSNVTAVAAGYLHSLALINDGTVVAWGGNIQGQITVPAGLSDVTAVAAGWEHSLAVKHDGTVVAWGRNDQGQTSVPVGLSHVTAIAAGYVHSLALRDDSTVVAWGGDYAGQTDVPAGLSNVTAIAAGLNQSLALKKDGTIVAWGGYNYPQTMVPAGLSNVTAIAAGSGYNLALKNDGNVVAWGSNAYGQTNVPAGLSNVIAIAAGSDHCLALKNDGTVVAWGRNDLNQTDVPAGLSHCAMIASGSQARHSFAFTNIVYSPVFAANGTIPGLLLPGNVLTNGFIGVTLTGAFSGNGSGLTALNAANLIGKIPAANLGNAVTNGATGVTLTGTFSGNGAGLAALNAANLTGTIPAANLGNALTNGATGVTLTGTFSGNGAGLTALNAANLTGTIPTANLGDSGSFLPTIGDGTHNFTTSTNSGYYAKTGDLVYFEAWVKWTSKGASLNGNLQVSLPFPVTSPRAVFNLGYLNGVSFNHQLSPMSQAGFNYLLLADLGASGGPSSFVQIGGASTAGEIMITGTYRWR